MQEQVFDCTATTSVVMGEQNGTQQTTLTAAMVLSCAAVFAVLLPGYYAASIAPSGAITAAAACPQKYWCQGGVPGQVFDPSNPAGLSPSEPSIQLCAQGTWTQDLGAVSPDQCCE